MKYPSHAGTVAGVAVICGVGELVDGRCWGYRKGGSPQNRWALVEGFAHDRLILAITRLEGMHIDIRVDVGLITGVVVDEAWILKAAHPH